MTTIAWDGNVLATDTRETSKGIGITSDKAVKLLVLDPAKHHYDGQGVVAFGCAGPSGGGRIIKALLAEGLTPLTIVPDKVSFGAIVITDDGKGHWLYTDEDYSYVVGEPAETEAIGSGGAYARSAMACGKTAAEAVAFAMRFDQNTGGEVKTFIYDKWLASKE